MKLGVVGHEQAKFTPHTEALARLAIGEAIDHFGNVDTLVSGHCPLGGVDLYAEEIAALRGLKMIVHAPQSFCWEGPGGYKARNTLIARDSDLVLVVALRDLPQGFTGLRHDICYHCAKHDGAAPSHVKGGGCWTAWQCEARAWALIAPDEAPAFYGFTQPKEKTRMAFGTSIKPKTSTSTQPAKKKPGGRFSGIAPRGQNNEPLLKRGEYIFEFLDSGLTRKRTCTWLDGFVIYAEGEVADKPLTAKQKEDGETPPKLRMFINHGDIGDQTFVSLAMAVCECSSVEELEEGEPDYDELIDAICCKPSAQAFCKKGESTPAFGVNPLLGMRVYIRVWDAEAIAKGGEPFRNFEFGICPDEYKKEE